VGWGGAACTCIRARAQVSMSVRASVSRHAWAAKSKATSATAKTRGGTRQRAPARLHTPRGVHARSQPPATLHASRSKAPQAAHL
jgi:hypothetical protein